MIFYVDSNAKAWVLGLEHVYDEKWHEGSQAGEIIDSITNYTSTYAAVSDTDGYTNTRLIRQAGTADVYPAAYAVDFANGWYLPAAGQVMHLMNNLTAVNRALTTVGAEPLHVSEGKVDNDRYYFWTSTVHSKANAWRVSNGELSIGIGSKSFRYEVLPVKTINVGNPNFTITTGQLLVNKDGTKGVVYYIDPDAQYGLMVALEDATNGVACAWEKTATDRSGANTGASTNYSTYFATAVMDGMKLTSYMDNTSGYARNKVVTQLNADWFVPSAAQLSLLYAAMPEVEEAILAAGGSAMLNAPYWSSTEYSKDNALVRNFNREIATANIYDNRAKTAANAHVRAIRRFGFGEVSRDDALTYQWDDAGRNSTTQYITVRPQEDTPIPCM
ncbi:MAG: hypothetical protein KBT04_07645 [Bacteroidales bacterium]|nr:hypothetical protein [Candidatus Colimorpha onthohippi]